MQEACEASDGAMAALIGPDRETAAAFCEEMGVELANLNCPGQTVVSGERARIEAAAEEGRRRGFRRVAPLKVAGAYHSRLMEPARERFAAYLEGVEFAEPGLTLISNVTGGPLSDPAEIRSALARQVVSPVLWEDCLRAAAALGAEEFWELGVGGTLCGLVRRTNRQWPCSSFETWGDLAP